ncbi:unnamed protein product, partial [Laminaria digitata]
LIPYSLNGRDLGVAFVGVDTDGLYPAASMNVGQAASFNFGYSPFLYSPADSSRGDRSLSRSRSSSSERSPVQPISEAVPNTTMMADPIYGNLSEPRERHFPDDLERQGLVETLIGMGFPIEWAIRAA